MFSYTWSLSYIHLVQYILVSSVSVCFLFSLSPPTSLTSFCTVYRTIEAWNIAQTDTLKLESFLNGFTWTLNLCFAEKRSGKLTLLVLSDATFRVTFTLLMLVENCVQSLKNVSSHFRKGLMRRIALFTGLLCCYTFQIISLNVLSFCRASVMGS